jgi:hypothetical protein
MEGPSPARQIDHFQEFTPRQPDQSHIERADNQQNGSDASLKIIQRKMQKTNASTSRNKVLDKDLSLS